jgi:gamma-butyrobetaine hydroxylase
MIARTQRQISQVQHETRHLTIEWSDGHRSRYDAIWLLDNAPENRDPKNGQRLADVADLPPDPAIADVGQDRDSLVIVWARDDIDHRLTVFGADWLRNHCYCGQGSCGGGAFLKKAKSWRAIDSADFCRMDASEVRHSSIARRRWLTSVAERGIGFLSNAGNTPGSVLELAAMAGYPRETNYGLIFDVRPVPSPNNLAYSDLGLGLHTDNPYRDPVPGLQMLHCLVNSSSGGENLFADGLAVAESLREADPESFAILCQTPVRFEFKDENTELSATRPLIQLDLDGEIKAIHYNSRSIAPLQIPAAEVAGFYSAYQAFAYRLRSYDFEYEVKLESGDVVLFDNTRVLHGRRAFSAATDARHLQGCYIDRDGLFSNIAVLERET